jgi:membrane protease YdiL (CAAX protease family)
MSQNDSFEQAPAQPEEYPGSLEGAGFSPHVGTIEPTRALAPAGNANQPEWAEEQESQSAPLFPDQFTSAEPPERLLFQSFTQPEVVSPMRIPHFGHLALLIAFASVGLLCSMLLVLAGLHFHLFGVATMDQAKSDIHYSLGSTVALYLITFAVSFFVFPVVWREGFFTGIHWNGVAALRLRWRLFGGGCLCFLLAMLDEVLIPSPAKAPIDEMFRSPAAAWMMLAFGITLAPFFEEIAFRGFLLPALATAWDWAIEQNTGRPVRPLDAQGLPQWSAFAMVVASIFTSVPFAAMHADQQGYALGPFLLLVAISLVLCAVRLRTRSVAASVLVHASYNFLLFSLMLLGTGGFRHLDKM